MSEHPRTPANPDGTNSAAVRTAAKLRGLIAEQDVDHAQLAADLGISRQTLRRWLQGRHALDLNAIQAIAERLNVSPAALWVDHPNDRIEKAA